MTSNFLNHLLSLLGKSNKDESLIDFFKSYDFIKSRDDLKLPIYDEDGELLDEYNFYLSKYNQGLSFIFTDESFYLNQSDKPITGENIYLTTIFFYNEGVEGFSQYKRGLPFEINFLMKQNQLEKNLGEPLFTKSDENLIVRSQKWQIKEYPFTLYVSYTNQGVIRYVSLSIPY